MLISKEKREFLSNEVKGIIKDNYNIEPNSIEVSQVFEVVFEEWLNDLENGGSHLSSSLVADDIVDIYERYFCSKKKLD